MTKLFSCPCCDKMTQPRSEPMTESQCHLAYGLMLMKGWTAESLLAERLADIDGLAPGMSDWLRDQVRQRARLAGDSP